MEGWIMLHRKLLDHAIFKNHKLLQVFLYCLLKASHKEHTQLVGDQLVTLQPGQLATGRKAIASKTGLTEQNVRTALNKLEKCGILTIRKTNKFSIVSIVKWNDHQQINQQVTSKQPASNQQVTTNNNVKNENNDNKYISFDDFWNIWPKKTAKQDAEKAWKKAKITEEIFILIQQHLAIAYLTTEKSYIPNPATYINGKRWNDEIIQPVNQLTNKPGFIETHTDKSWRDEL